MSQILKIGTVAKRAGVSVDAIRFYERRGVLRDPARNASGYRQYSEATIDRIRFAKSLQALGFTLDEIADLFHDVDAGIATCRGERPRFETVLARIERKIAELHVVHRNLTATLESCSLWQECAGRANGRDTRLTWRRH